MKNQQSLVKNLFACDQMVQFSLPDKKQKAVKKGVKMNHIDGRLADFNPTFSKDTKIFQNRNFVYSKPWNWQFLAFRR